MSRNRESAHAPAWLDLLPATVRVRLAETDLGCFEWQGFINSHGYGVVRLGPGDRRYVHRVVYEAIVGPIPEDMEIDHLCRNTKCSKPNHLEAVTHRVNILRGQTVMAAEAKRTRCPRGHAYDLVSKRGDGRTFRDCRTCRDERIRRSKARAAVNGSSTTEDADV